MEYKTYLRNTDKYPKFEENPFLQSVLSKKTIKKKYENVWLKPEEILSLAVVETGEEIKVSAFAKDGTKFKDYRKFSKLYPIGIRILSELNNYELKVFLYMVTQLEADKDCFYFSMVDCKKICNYKNESVINTAITGLLDKKIISRTLDKLRFWINPLIVYNGDIVPAVSRYAMYLENLNEELIESEDKESEHQSLPDSIPSEPVVPFKEESNSSPQQDEYNIF